MKRATRLRGTMKEQTDLNICNNCKINPPNKPHICPFAKEIGDCDEECNCCDDCTKDCGEDI